VSRDDEDCQTCKQLRQLLEAHPSTDKRRILQAEEQLAQNSKEVEALRRQMLPDRSELAVLRTAICRTDTILRDQRMSLQSRVYEACSQTSPYAVQAKVGDPDLQMKGPPSADVNRLTLELLTLRGIIRDASALHMAELDRLKAEFDAYDDAMVQAVRDHLEAHGTPLGQDNSRTAALRIVNHHRDVAIAARQGSPRNRRSPTGRGPAGDTSIGYRSGGQARGVSWR
jgi:hypothetical protein